MRKTCTYATVAFALSACAALAQTDPGGAILRGPNAEPPAAGTADPPRGADDAQAPHQYRNQAEGAQRIFSTGNADDPHTVAITDEYGNQYNSRGERIGHGSPIH